MVTVGAGLAVDVGLIVGLAAGAGLSAVPLLPQVTETSSPLVTADRVASVTTGAETMVSESSLLRSPSPSAFARYRAQPAPLSASDVAPRYRSLRSAAKHDVTISYLPLTWPR